MNKKYNYNIKITFDKNRNECKVGVVNSNYLNGGLNSDTFRFNARSFSLNAYRTRIYKDGTILSNTTNSINAQILKGLLFYYSLANDFPRITDVSIKRKQAKNIEYQYMESTSGIVQPIIGVGTKPQSFQANDISILFEESEKGSSIRIVLSYWLKAIASEERYYKFDHLWRAYNRLFMYQGNCTKEIECMAQMRAFIINNSGIFLRTTSITNSYSSDMLRGFRWRKMILNDYDTPSKAKAFDEFVRRYHDLRIMSLLSDMLPYREEFLRRANLLESLQAYITNNNSRYDTELVTLLSLKYAYFVRNKMFHGEIPDSTFKIHSNSEDEEIDRLNEILISLIFEIIINNRLLR